MEMYNEAAHHNEIELEKKDLNSNPPTDARSCE